MLSEMVSPQQSVNGFQSEKVFGGDRGRLQYNISKEQRSSYFIVFGFKALQVATMLGVSKSTIRRRSREFNLQLSTRCYTNVLDEQLDKIVSSIRIQQSGYRMLTGILKYGEKSWT